MHAEGARLVIAYPLASSFYDWRVGDYGGGGDLSLSYQIKNCFIDLSGCSEIVGINDYLD